MRFDKKTAIIILAIMEVSYIISLIPHGGTPQENARSNVTIFYRELDSNEEINYLRKGLTLIKIYYSTNKPNYIDKLYRTFDNQLLIEVINSTSNKTYIFNGYTGYEKEIDTNDYNKIVSELCKAVVKRPPMCLTNALGE